MRKPDIVIGDSYLSRWYLIRRNRFLNVYWHRFDGSDDDRALHDHPWWSISFLFAGEIKEISFSGVRLIPRFLPVIRSAKFAHRLELIKGPVYTLFITGPKIREWGFHCPTTWRHWSLFTDGTGRNVGPGCGGDIVNSKE